VNIIKLKFIFSIFLVLALFAVSIHIQPGVGAHQDPARCTLNSAGVAIGVFRSDGVTPVAGTVQSGETIRYQSTLFNGPPPSFCNFSGGTLVVTTPDGVVHDVTPGGGIPLVTNASPFSSALVDYVVSEADVNASDLLQATTQYTSGESHIADIHQQANAGPNGIAVTYQDVALIVDKSANPAFDSQCTWEITKDVDVSQHDLLTGQFGTSNYDVSVSSTCLDANHSVTGTISILNPAEFASATIDSVDDLVDAIVATVDCTGDPSFAGFPHNLSPGATLTCTYQAVLSDNTTRTNTATATTSGDVDGGQGTASVDFTNVSPSQTTNESITVDDTFAGPLGTCSATSDLECLFEYARTFVCDADAGQHDNTATIVETGQSADASVNVTCTPPVEDVGCTLTQGYWKTHSASGPAPYDAAGWGALGDFDGDTFEEEAGETLPGSTQSWLQVFKTPPKGGNVWYQLAHQFMAAYLNVQTGASAPTEVSDALTSAEAWLAAHTPGQNLKAKSAPEAGEWASLLGSYNEGTIGPGHCE
jgi:hypothetical protein